MKKLILFLFIITTQISLAQTKDELQFKIQYNPETKYVQTLEQNNHMEMTYSGTPEFIEKLKTKGIQNPNITDNNSLMESVFKTGKLINKIYFPLTIEFLKTTNSDNKIIIPNGTIIYGKGTVGNLPTLDSIVSKGLSEELKKSMLKMIQTTFLQLNFPERTVKVGERFSVDSPLSIPMADTSLDMTITTNYTLLSIKNNVADFDVTQDYTMKSKFTKYNVDAIGSGKGKLLYDVINNYNLKYQVDINMVTNLKMADIELNVVPKSGLIQTAKIIKL